MRSGCQVIVIGAGMAGLVAAARLERLGNQVDIREADHRIGGRILKHRFRAGPDAPSAELGATRIPERHRQTLARIEQVRLAGRQREFSTPLSGRAAVTAGRLPPRLDR